MGNWKLRTSKYIWELQNVLWISGIERQGVTLLCLSSAWKGFLSRLLAKGWRGLPSPLLKGRVELSDTILSNVQGKLFSPTNWNTKICNTVLPWPVAWGYCWTWSLGWLPWAIPHFLALGTSRRPRICVAGWVTPPPFLNIQQHQEAFFSTEALTFVVCEDLWSGSLQLQKVQKLKIALHLLPCSHAYPWPGYRP